MCLPFGLSLVRRGFWLFPLAWIVQIRCSNSGNVVGARCLRHAEPEFAPTEWPHPEIERRQIFQQFF